MVSKSKFRGCIKYLENKICCFVMFESVEDGKAVNYSVELKTMEESVKIWIT